ncbi:MAG: hypothetical protein JXR53_10375 [Bacteroidales bacterium]|nr:hypothetical protein [Bacteroidales bacterium]
MIRQKTSTSSIALLLLIFFFSSCNLLNQREFAYLNKVPATSVSVEHQKDFPAPRDIKENEKSEPVFLDYVDSNNNDKEKPESKTPKKDFKKQAEKTIRNLLFPDFKLLKAKISAPDESKESLIWVTLLALAIITLVILIHVITKTNLGCGSLVVIIFCIVFIIFGLVY